MVGRPFLPKAQSLWHQPQVKGAGKDPADPQGSEWAIEPATGTSCGCYKREWYQFLPAKPVLSLYPLYTLAVPFTFTGVQNQCHSKKKTFQGILWARKQCLMLHSFHRIRQQVFSFMWFIWGVQGVVFPGSDYFILTKGQCVPVKRLSPSKNRRLKKKILSWRLIALMQLVVRFVDNGLEWHLLLVRFQASLRL